MARCARQVQLHACSGSQSSVFASSPLGSSMHPSASELCERFRPPHRTVHSDSCVRVRSSLHAVAYSLPLAVRAFRQAATQLGMLVTTTLAVHNVPEGFAVSMVLCSKGMSVWGASLWSVFTSLPQPVMALLAYRCVDAFVLIQPVGLGFAAGAMLWVAWFELFSEAHEACGLVSTSIAGLLSALAMALTHAYLL